MSVKRKIQIIINSITPRPIKELAKIISLYKWYSIKSCSAPPPSFVKQSVLLRHGTKGCTWIESGTYLGATTKLLASKYHHVHTIEPSSKCLDIAKSYLGKAKNVTFYNGTSEGCIDKACSAAVGDVCFWLDGHNSGGITYQGDAESPILHELATIERHLGRYKSVVVIIDDIRFSNLASDHYPSLDYYVEWSRSNNLNWIIEQDLFVAKSRELEIYPPWCS